MIFAAVLPLLFSFVPLAVDKSGHSVTFTARATAVTKNATVEFAFVGPNSDRAYEAMFVTDAGIAEIAKAFDEAGIPRGRPVSTLGCRFWPAGKSVTFSPSVWDFISDSKGERMPNFCCTGGLRNGSGIPVADTNMPAAVFALYALDQSLLLAANTEDQSAAYGRYTNSGKAESGKRYSFTVAWDGKSGTEARRLVIEPGKLREAIGSLKGAASDLDVMPVFSEQLTVAEAKAAASALAVVDSRAVRINGYAEGQFFYRGFLPNELWRDRSKRLTQPLEVRVDSTNAVFTVIDEDWNVEGLDPKLTPHDETADAVGRLFKGDSCLIYAGAGTKLDRVYEVMKKLPKSIRNWYVFVD